MFLFQRLIIVGWVQLLDRELEYGRLLVGLTVSILYLAVLLNQRPYKRDDIDDFSSVLQVSPDLIYRTPHCCDVCEFAQKDHRKICFSHGWAPHRRRCCSCSSSPRHKRSTSSASWSW